MRPGEFLRMLCGYPDAQEVLGDACATISFKRGGVAGWTSEHVPVSCLGEWDEDEFDQLVAEYQAEGFPGDVYASPGLRRGGLDPSQVGKKVDVVALAGFAMDYDLWHEGRKYDDLPRTEDEIAEIVSVGPEPTVVVNSGYGIQPWYLFDRPISIRTTSESTYAQKAYKNFAQQFYAKAKEMGLRVDPKTSIQGLFRLPGTKNWKGAEPADVLVIGLGPRFAPRDLEVVMPQRRYATLREYASVAVIPGLEGVCRAMRRLRPDHQHKAMIDSVLRGESFAEPGDRNRSVQVAASVVAWLSPARQLSAESLAEIFRPSLSVWASEPGADKTLEYEMGNVVDKLNEAIEQRDAKEEERKQQRQAVLRSLERSRVRAPKAESAGEPRAEASDGEEEKPEDDFDPDDVDAETPFEWDVKLGRPRAQSQMNVVIALKRLGIELGHDAFVDQMLISGFEGYGPVMDDEVVVALRLAVDQAFEFLVPKDLFWDVVTTMARANAHNPVLDYLDSLEWDGVRRIDTWLSTYGRAEDSEYARAVARVVLVAAVRRAREPGCKFDEMLILECDQGTEKSSALKILAVKDAWFTDDLPLHGRSREQLEAIQGCWIVEAGELKGMNKSDHSSLKSFLSRQVDQARMAYARTVKKVPRQCVIIGTTNDAAYLKDSTGNRRYWPIKVERFDLESLRRDRDQLWAEAAAAEASGDSIRLDPNLYPVAAEEQEKRLIVDPFVEKLEAVLGDRTGKIRAQDVWDMVGVPIGQRTQAHNERLGAAMRRLGWERSKRSFDAKQEWCYVRGTEEERFVWLESEVVMGRVKIKPHLKLVPSEEKK